MKRKIILIIFLMFLVVGCSINSEEKKSNDPLFIQGEENAINYIKEKYNFTPKIVNIRCTYPTNNSFDKRCLDIVAIEASYKDKTFKIQIDGTKETFDGKDDYQKDEITKDLINNITSDFGTPHSYNIYYGLNGSGLINEYYNGNNMESIINNLKVLVEYINHDYFINDKDKLSSSKYSIYKKLYIINYKSTNSYNKLKKELHFLNIESGLEEKFTKYSDDLLDGLTINTEGINYYKNS